MVDNGCTLILDHETAIWVSRSYADFLKLWTKALRESVPLELADSGGNATALNPFQIQRVRPGDWTDH